MPTAVREKETKIRLSSRLDARLKSVWDHPVWDHFDWSEGRWPLSGKHIHAAYVSNHSPDGTDTFEPGVQSLRTAHNKEAFCEGQDDETEEDDDESSDEDEGDLNVDYAGFDHDDDLDDDQDESDYKRNHNGSDRKGQLYPSIDQSDGIVAAAFNEFLELLF